MVAQKVAKNYFLSFLRKQESSLFKESEFLGFPRLPAGRRFHGNDDLIRNYQL